MSDGSKKRDRSRKECRREDIRGSGRNLIDGNGIQSDNSQKGKRKKRGEGGGKHTYHAYIQALIHTFIFTHAPAAIKTHQETHTYKQ